MSVSKTKISWTESTWNPVAGCTHAGSGCYGCYAERMARRLQAMGKPGYEGVTDADGWTGRVNLRPEALDQPLRWRKPRVIFVPSMGDLFHESLTFEQIAAVFEVMAKCQQHTFLVLTKRPARMAEFFEFAQARAEDLAASIGGTVEHHSIVLPNVWLGVSCWDQESADRMIPLLLETPAAYRVVSLEPLLGSVDFSRYLLGEACPRCETDAAVVGCRSTTEEPSRWYCRRPECCDEEGFGIWGIDAVLVGGETGPRSRPCDVSWVRAIVEQCRAGGVPCHVKAKGWKPVGDWSGLVPPCGTLGWISR